MAEFTVQLTKRGGLFTGSITPLPRGLKLAPRTWSADENGGPVAATIEAFGPKEALEQLLGWIGDHVLIVNDRGTKVWWGYIHELEVSYRGVTVTRTFESLYNRVAVRYNFTLPDGSTESRVTDWADNTASQQRYGRRELLYGMNDEDDDNPERVRNRLLGRLGRPGRVITSQGADVPIATLLCRGYYELADAIYYEEQGGLDKHEAGSNDTLRLGASYLSNQISFGPAADPSGGADDIKDAAGGFGPLVKGTRFRVSGASQPANNGVFVVKSQVDNTHIETVEATQVNEAAGANVRISMLHKRVTRIAQRFQASGGTEYNNGAISLRMRKIGSPSDAVRVGLYTDNAGAPGTLLEQVDVPASALFTEMQWIDANMSNSITLTQGQHYWIVVQRTGSDSLANHYEIAVDVDQGYTGGYAMIDYGTGTFVTPDGTEDDPNFDLLFRIKGRAFVSTLIRRALEQVPDFADVVAPEPSGNGGDLHFPNAVSVKTRVADLLDRGTLDGRRMRIEITPDRMVWIRKRPLAEDETAPLLMDDEGNIRYGPGGALLEPGVLPVGRWIKMTFLPGEDRAPGEEDRLIYIAHAEYSTDKNRVIVRSEDAPDPMAVVRFERG